MHHNRKCALAPREASLLLPHPWTSHRSRGTSCSPSLFLIAMLTRVMHALDSRVLRLRITDRGADCVRVYMCESRNSNVQAFVQSADEHGQWKVYRHARRPHGAWRVLNSPARIYMVRTALMHDSNGC